MSSNDLALDVCLQCGESRESVKANEYICGIMGGGEYNELIMDWPTHRWADWNDRELTAAGIKSGSFHKYRRTPIQSLPYSDCKDMVRGHILATKETDYRDYGAKIGQCIDCRQYPEIAKKAD